MDSPLLPLVCVWLDNNFPKIGAKLRKRTNCTSTPEISLEDVFAKYALLLAQVRPKNGKKRKLPENDGSQKVKGEPDRKKKRTKESASTSKEDDSDSSSSSSDTSSDDENTTKETPGKDDDSSSSSSSEDDSDAGGDATAEAKETIEGSDSDDSSSSEDEDVPKEKAADSDSDSDNSSSSSSSSSDEDKDVKTKKKKNKESPEGSDSDDSSDDGDDKAASSSSDDSSSDSDSDDESSDGEVNKSKKKSKKVIQAPVIPVQKKPKRKRGPPNRPFQRVKAGAVTFVNEKLKDNTYNLAESFGRKASETLLKVKGKDFVKSKNKHKRKTYFGGGRIDMGVRSIKF